VIQSLRSIKIPESLTSVLIYRKIGQLHMTYN
jgi:hypothetical protein